MNFRSRPRSCRKAQSLRSEQLDELFPGRLEEAPGGERKDEVLSIDKRELEPDLGHKGFGAYLVGAKIEDRKRAQHRNPETLRHHRGYDCGVGCLERQAPSDIGIFAEPVDGCAVAVHRIERDELFTIEIRGFHELAGRKAM